MKKKAYNKNGIFFVIVILIIGAISIASNSSSKTSGSMDNPKDSQTKAKGKKELTAREAVEALKPGDGAYAVIDTSKGRIITVLYEKQAPLATENFIGLAEGTKEFMDPKTREWVKRRFYDGLTFHRVIADFMIQGGCPLGTGTGGPGYTFKNEIVPDLKFDKPGRLAYANAGPDTNGSQFFITHKATPFLDLDKGSSGYTIFGQTIKGQEVVNAIGSVKKDGRDKPIDPVIIKRIDIVRIKSKK